MQLLAIVDSPNHVCCRYRLRAFESTLNQVNHRLEYRAWPEGLFARYRACRNVTQFDAVIVQRKLLPGWLLRPLRRRAKRLIFDLDDAVFLRDSYSKKGLYDRRRLRRFIAVTQAADAVIAGNSFLARHVEIHAPQTPTFVIPTCVNPDLYPQSKHEGRSLTWIGSSSTLQGLEQIHSILESVGRSCPDATLKLICDRSLTLNHLRVEFSPWSEATEASDLASADIGISWIPDDDWSRGKCGLKALQYMAAGLPVVANPVGVHTEMIRHGDNGFLVETPEEWQSAIQCLLRDAELRRRMGSSGRRLVEATYSTSHGASLWCEVLRNPTLSRRKTG